MIKNTEKLTIICNNLECGGTEKVITNLANFYSNAGIETTIITLGPANIFSRFALSKKINIIELPKILSKNIYFRFKNIFIWILEINKYIKKNRNSIYLSFLTIPIILTILSSLNTKIYHVGSERINPKYVNLSFNWRLLRLISYWRLNMLVVQTSEIKNIFKKFVIQKKITIIPNSIKNLKEYKNIKKDKSILRVLFLGRLEYQKGVDIILEAIRKISHRKTKNKFIFEIVGDGSLKKIVESEIKSKKLKNYVNFINGTNNPNKFIRDSDILLHPSRYEGMSNVVLEAMSFGKCVISTYEASSEIITNYKNGLLMKEITSEEIIKNLEIILEKQYLLKEISNRAISTINLYYIEKRIFNIWNSVLGFKISTQ